MNAVLALANIVVVFKNTNEKGVERGKDWSKVVSKLLYLVQAF